LAMGDADVPAQRMQDPWGRHVPAESRDPERTPMPWDASPNAGFCPPDVTPWLPLTDDAATRNVDVQCDDPASELHLVHDLLSLRRARSSLRAGAYEQIHVDGTVFMFARTDGDERTVVVLSFADAPRTVALDGPHDMLRSTIADRSGQVDGEVQLAPYEAVVLAPVT
jgi:alpha-glucosidase